jgi:hypothetical protein
MYAIPPRVDVAPEPQLAGLSCPDCCGSLSVQPEGKRSDLVFECRVGHTYSVDDLLIAKEERIRARRASKRCRARRSARTMSTRC